MVVKEKIIMSAFISLMILIAHAYVHAASVGEAPEGSGRRRALHTDNWWTRVSSFNHHVLRHSSGYCNDVEERCKQGMGMGPYDPFAYFSK